MWISTTVCSTSDSTAVVQVFCMYMAHLLIVCHAAVTFSRGPSSATIIRMLTMRSINGLRSRLARSERPAKCAGMKITSGVPVLMKTIQL